MVFSSLIRLQPGFEIPSPWQKCQNNQSDQKHLGRVLAKTDLESESQRVSRTLRILFHTRWENFALPDIGFALQESFLGTVPQRPDNTFCNLLKHFWAFRQFLVTIVGCCSEALRPLPRTSRVAPVKSSSWLMCEICQTTAMFSETQT